MALDEAKVKAKIKSIIEFYALTKVEHIQAWEDSFGNWMVSIEIKPEKMSTLYRIEKLIQFRIQDTFKELKLRHIEKVLLPEIPRADQRYTRARLDILLNPRAPGELSATEEEGIARMCHMLAAVDKANRQNQKEEPTMKLIDMVKLTTPGDKITLILRGEETSEPATLTPHLLAEYSENHVEKLTADDDQLLITVSKKKEFGELLTFARNGCGCT